MMSSKSQFSPAIKSMSGLNSQLEARACRFSILAIFDDRITSETSKEIEEHLEKCSECRNALEGFEKSSPEWWGIAKDSWLEGDLVTERNDQRAVVTLEVGMELPEDSPLELERVSLDFLDQPAHPELLGKLGRFDVERVIGVGGMGIVLKAHDTELHRVVALKVLARHLANNASARRRFAREAQAAAAVLHHNVIPIYNVESESQNPYLVMQYVNGQSLQAKVDEHGPLTIAEALRIAKQTAAGLAAAHQQGLVHRDVKPANILLEENVDRVLLSDFGLARAVDDASLTRTGIVAGTPHYMSPEQARGDSLSFASDLFSLGSVMYFMLSGHPPFRAQNAMGVLNRICHDPHRPLDQINSSIPVEVAAIVDRLLDKNPESRFASMSQLEQEIDALLTALQTGGFSLRKANARIFRKLTKEHSSHKVSIWSVTSRRSIGIVATLAMIAILFGVGRNVLPSWLRSGTALQPESANMIEVDGIVQEDSNWQADWNSTVTEAEQQINAIQRQDQILGFQSQELQDFAQTINDLQQQINQLEQDDSWGMFQSRFSRFPTELHHENNSFQGSALE
jgi:serine/threonine protein kinase